MISYTGRQADLNLKKLFILIHQSYNPCIFSRCMGYFFLQMEKKMKKLFMVLAAALLLAVMACSSKSDDVSSGNIGSAGGTVVSSDGNATLNVPTGALSTDKTINIAESTEGDPPGAISSSYNFTPDGLTFNSDVTVSVKYDPALIPKSINETDLQLAYAQNGNWIPLTNSTVDTTNHVISAPTNHFTPYAGTCGTYIPYNKNGPALGNLNGVDVYSNGFPTNNSEDENNDAGTYTGIRWQCVEFVNRYYWQTYGVDINQQPRTNANGYYTNAIQKGLISYENGLEPPQPGDIIVSEGGGYGHVAIVRIVLASYITVTQQNYCENKGDLEFTLSRDGNKIGSFGGGKSYPIKGWLRLPSVSGKVTLNGTGLSGVGVMLTGISSKQTSTDANGNYLFTGVANDSYTLKVFESGYAFMPSSQSITVNNVDLANLTVNKGILTVQDIIATVSSSIPTGYTITDLGTLGGELSINNSGQIIGWAIGIDNNSHAFLYSGGTMNALGELSGDTFSNAYGINDSGQIVGASVASNGVDSRPFLYSGGIMTELLIPISGSIASGINDNGTIIGYSTSDSNHGFIYNGGTITDLGFGTQPHAINNSGQVVGFTGNFGWMRAFLYSNGEMTNLGTLPGDIWSDAYDINNSGQVAGSSFSSASGTSRAFIYSNKEMTNLGTLAGDTGSTAYDINDNSQVVGFSFTVNGGLYDRRRAFLYSGGIMIDLNSLIDPTSGWQLTVAYGINNLGQIVGEGIYNGNTRAFLLTPN